MITIAPLITTKAATVNIVIAPTRVIATHGIGITGSRLTRLRMTNIVGRVMINRPRQPRQIIRWVHNLYTIRVNNLKSYDNLAPISILWVKSICENWLFIFNRHLQVNFGLIYSQPLSNHFLHHTRVFSHKLCELVSKPNIPSFFYVFIFPQCGEFVKDVGTRCFLARSKSTNPNRLENQFRVN